MGLGLLLLAAGAFVRFVLGRYAGVDGVLDPPGTVLLLLGVAAIAVTVLAEVADHVHVVRASSGGTPERHEPDRG